MEEIKRVLAKMIIIYELFFSIVKGEGFKNYYRALEPRLVVPFCIIIARDCMKIYKGKKLK